MRNVEASMRAKLNITLTVLQEDIEHELRTKDFHRIQRKLSSLRSDYNLKHISLIDEKDNVFMKGKFDIKRKILNDILPSDKIQRDEIKKQIVLAKKRLAGVTLLSDDKNTLWGICPVQFGSSAGGLRPTKLGVLIAQLDLSAPKATALNLVKNQVVQFCLFLGLLVVGLWLYISFQVTQRIQGLVLATENFSKGDFKALIDIKGNDEISYLANSMAKMAKMRLQAEERVHELSEVVKQSPVSVLITDKDGTIEYANPFFIALTGYSLKELIGENPQVLKSGEMSPEFYKELWDTIKSGRVWRGEIQNKKKNGEIYWESAIISPLLTDGNVTHFIAIKEDITEKKKNEEMLKITQKQLLVSHKLASVGELAAGVSHEVLNPANIISVQTQMLQRKTKDNPLIQEHCTKVIHEIGRITKIVGGLLVFAREGGTKIEKGFLKDDIEKVLVLVEEEYKLDNIEIIRKWCDKPVEVLYDSDKMRQVFLNLLHNAKYAMPKGGTITVSCFAVKNFHQFTFSDTGTGMSEEIRLKIFDPFFTTKPEGEGTGMGLSVVYGIIEEHNGEIKVESEEGKGTTFIISLPII